MGIQTNGVVRISDAGQLQNISGMDGPSQGNVASAVVSDIRSENHTILVKNAAGTTLKTFYCIPPA